MCGIAGILNLADSQPAGLDVLQAMLAMLRHRGPDEFGVYRDEQIGLGNARLSIIDLSGGTQPLSNEDGRYWIVFNGEIFNYIELRPDLEARGHRFSTHSDTEVIVHLYEEYGPDCLRYLNGQFSIAVWDRELRRLFLARDRLGVRPLFYTRSNGRLVFGSEIKSILACPGTRAELDPKSLDQIFTFWSTLPGRTAFKDIAELPPGHYLVADRNGIHIEQYWSMDFADCGASQRPDSDYRDEFESLLIDATRIRLRADVPVGAYLSGGLDSSLTTAIVRKHTGNRLETFSIAFENPEFDESVFQLRMAEFLGTEHRVIRCTHADIGKVFPEVVWHAETPVLRTAPAPLFMLSRLVHEHGLKVVLTGEGADEFLGGYDIFKEMKLRRFWARQPESKWRPLLLRRLYPDIAGLGNTSSAFLAAFFKRDLEKTGSPFYSHMIRWANTSWTRRFLAHASTPELPLEDVRLPREFGKWPGLGQAQYLEAAIFLSQYLLSSQGDRVAMAHSVEGRYPFLDYRVVEFANRMPAHLKVRVLREKWLLKQIGSKLLPTEIWNRPKRPYRAPVHRSFFPAVPAYVQELISEPALKDAGCFKPAAVAQLERKARSGARMSEVEDMALAGIISTQLVHHQFVARFTTHPFPGNRQIKVVDKLDRSSQWTA